MDETQYTIDRFDRIADIYDETREPLSEQALDLAAQVLSRDGCRNLIEVGVGTGRIAKPLLQRRFAIVGVDLSRGMLAKARQKGIQDLVMGDANNLPFGDKKFDAALLAHVLHLLERPADTFEKLARVARKEIVIFVRKRDGEASRYMPDDERLGVAQAFKKAADELGYPMPPRSEDWRRRLRNDTEFLSNFPPNELTTIQDLEKVTTLGERLSLIEKRAYGHHPDISEATLHKIVEKVRSSVDTGREVRYRRIEQMAVWRLPQ
jgi:SAM-dependent methyltransferase